MGSRSLFLQNKNTVCRIAESWFACAHVHGCVPVKCFQYLKYLCLLYSMNLKYLNHLVPKHNGLGVHYFNLSLRLNGGSVATLGVLQYHFLS